MCRGMILRLNWPLRTLTGWFVCPDQSVSSFQQPLTRLRLGRRRLHPRGDHRAATTRLRGHVRGAEPRGAARVRPARRRRRPQIPQGGKKVVGKEEGGYLCGVQDD